MEVKMNKPIIIASDQSWIEGDAIAQLNHVAGLPGMEKAVGLPDLHPGKGIPVGAAFLSKDIIYPHLVGNDIGCGMGLWLTDQKSHKFKICLLYTSPSPRDRTRSRMPSSA